MAAASNTASSSFETPKRHSSAPSTELPLDIDGVALSVGTVVETDDDDRSPLQSPKPPRSGSGDLHSGLQIANHRPALHPATASPVIAPAATTASPSTSSTSSSIVTPPRPASSSTVTATPSTSTSTTTTRSDLPPVTASPSTH